MYKKIKRTTPYVMPENQLLDLVEQQNYEIEKGNEYGEFALAYPDTPEGLALRKLFVRHFIIQNERKNITNNMSAPLYTALNINFIYNKHMNDYRDVISKYAERKQTEETYLNHQASQIAICTILSTKQLLEELEYLEERDYILSIHPERAEHPVKILPNGEKIYSPYDDPEAAKEESFGLSTFIETVKNIVNF